MDADWFARVIVPVIAVAGLALGVWNTVWAHLRGTTRMRIIPVVRPGAGSILPYIERIRVVNHSEFDVDIDEVGVVSNEGKTHILFSATTASPARARTIKARSSEEFVPTTHMVILSAMEKLRSCYAKTTDGKVSRRRVPKPLWTRLKPPSRPVKPA